MGPRDRRQPRHLVLLALMFIATTWSWRVCDAAMVIQGYDPDLHDRFVDHPSFIGNPYDWSGVGRSTLWATLVSPSYFVSATHGHPGTGAVVRFYEGNQSTGPYEEHTVIGGTQIAGSDLWLGRLETPVSNAIATYPILSLPNPAAFEGLELFTFGLSNTSPTQTSMRLGRNELDEVLEDFSDPNLGASHGDVFVYDYDTTGGVGADESYLQGGDSGGPTFTIVNGTPVLLGIHWFIYSDDDGLGGIGSGDTLVSSYIDDLNAQMIGESVTPMSVPGPPAGVLAAVSLVLLAAFRRRLRVTTSEG